MRKKLTEPDSRRNFKDFYCHTRLKLYFRDEPTPFFSERLSFSLSPSIFLSPPVGNPILEVLLSQIEHEFFRIPEQSFTYSSLTKEG